MNFIGVPNELTESTHKVVRDFEDDEDELIEENDINTETAQMIEETPESKLIDKLLEYRANIAEEQGCSKATMNSIEVIAYTRRCNMVYLLLLT